MRSKEEIDSLVQRAKGGDEEAMEGLVRHVEQPLMRFLFHLSGSEQMAQDLSQETLVKILTKITQLKEERGFMSWVYQVARNQFLDEKRRTKRTESSDVIEEKDEEVGDSIPEEVLAVRNILEQLELPEREVLILVDMEGYSYLEAAEILQVSESAVRSRVHRARTAFLTDYREKHDDSLVEKRKKEC